MHKKSFLFIAIMALLLSIFSASAGEFVDLVKSRSGVIAKGESRVTGSEGNAKAREYINSTLKATPNVSVFSQEFSVNMPTIDDATLQVVSRGSKQTHKIYPIWPDSVRLNTTAKNGITGNLVYVGKSDYKNLPARSLKGAIAVMEMSEYNSLYEWRRVFDYGADALILLGSKDDSAAQPVSISVYKPRFYIPEGKLAESIRKGEISQATIKSSGAWKKSTGVNIIATVAPATQKEYVKPLVLVVPYDSMSVVMGQAQGADNAVDAAFLLSLVQHFSKYPAPRGVVAAFVDSNSINMLGVRNLYAMLGVTEDDNTRMMYVNMDKEKISEYEEVEALAKSLPLDEIKALEQLNDKSRYALLQRYVKDEVSPKILQLKNKAAKLRLASRKANKIDPQLKVLEKELFKFNSLLAQIVMDGKIAPDNYELARSIWRNVLSRASSQLQDVKGRSLRFTKDDELRGKIEKSLNMQPSPGRPFPFVIGLDLSDASNNVGPALWCSYEIIDASLSAREFLRWMKNSLKYETSEFYQNLPASIGRFGFSDDSFLSAYNRSAIGAMQAPESFTSNDMALLSSLSTAFQMNGVTWASLEGKRFKVDTPQDNIKNLNWQNLNPQIQATAVMLDILMRDTSFNPVGAGSAGFPKWRMPHGSIVSESVAETIPRTPEPNMLTTLVAQDDNFNSNRVKGIRGHEFVRSSSDGSFQFDPIKVTFFWSALVRKKIQSFACDDDGRIVKSISRSNGMIAGQVQTELVIDKHVQPPLKPLRALTFDCVEVNGPVFRDPRYQQTLNEYSLIDVQRGGTPKRYEWCFNNGLMSGLLPPDMNWQLIMRIGSVNKRMVALNIPPELSEGEIGLRDALSNGFSLTEKFPALAELVSAKDFYSIDEWRLQRLEKAGVVNQAIREIHKTSKEWIEKAQQAINADNGGAYKRAAVAALANEIRVYHAVLDQSADVTRGAIFLLLLLVPFSIAMERLLIAAPSIGKQIIFTSLIFIFMGAVLSSFHPGFRISSQPSIVLLAFFVLLLSMIVVLMVMNKFRADMEEMRQGSGAQINSVATGRNGVISSAVWLGIANMRKRLLRTVLTALTIVLVTFCLLCFTSSSTYQDKRTVTLPDIKPTHNGVLLQHPSLRALDHETKESVDNILSYKYPVVGRYWYSSYNPMWRMHVRSPKNGTLAMLKAGLGLEANEDKLTGVAEVLPNWDKFANGEGCYVSSEVAEELGVKEGDILSFTGLELPLLGTFSAKEFENKIRRVDGAPLLPLDYSSESDHGLSQDAMETQLAGGSVIGGQGNMTFVSGREVLIMPAATARKLDASLRNLVVIPNEGNIKDVVNELMKITVYPLFYGEGDKVKAMVSTPLLPKAPRNLLIPILIAALIIFNTMLNSIAERKNEIHIYSSLGLAPRHIGVLFLAEALTYGLMGSVLGYILGQGVATILVGFDLMGGITLNYSGSSVIMTMGLVLGIVTLSSLVPAYMATKVASPSKDLDWKIPQPDDGIIKVLLPFTVSKMAAPGMAAYLYEYIEAHAEGAIGNFTSDNLELNSNNSEASTNAELLNIHSTIWLAPYDLGVRQDINLVMTDVGNDICALNLILKHETGQIRSWWRLNHVFITGIRSQLLQWRNIQPERVLGYIEQSKGLDKTI